MFIMIGNTAAAGAATGTVLVDGVSNTTTVDWSNLTMGPASVNTAQNPATDPMFAAIAHAGSNETYDIHDFRLQANQAGSVFTIAGVVVYSENSTLTIDQFPGVTYNNKTRSQTTQNTTLALPSFGASTGGRSTIYKGAFGGYSLSMLGVSTVISAATGSSGTNIINVTTGTGASFAAGNGIITSFGTSMYVGVIQSVSTDALTVYPTLIIGVSNSIYRYFQAGQSQAINASLSVLNFTFGSTEMIKQGFTSPFLDPLQNFCVWGNNYGVTALDGINTCLGFSTASGFIQCEGYFSAAEIEWFGMSFGVLSGTMIVNGLPAYSHANIGFTGMLKKTVFHNAGPGWNSFAFLPGSSHVNVGIARINLYGRNYDQSASFGLLASFDTLQAYTSRSVNATCVAPGTYQRKFADQILFKGPWVRGAGTTLPGSVAYYGATTTCTASFQYWGTNFAVIGGASYGRNASMQISVDAGANQGATAIGTIIDGLSQTFHSVSLAVLGGTCVISAIDFFRQTGEMKNIQTFAQPTLTNPAPVKLNRPSKVIDIAATASSGTYFPSPGTIAIRVRIVGAGGGGGGGCNNSGGSGGGGGGSGGYCEKLITNLLSSYAFASGGAASGGSAGASGGAGNTGGNSTFAGMTASGGLGGQGGTGVVAPGQGGAGGAAAGGDINIPGQNGANGAPGTNGVAQGIGGSGGNNPIGQGGLGAASNATGTTGGGYGGGAGGGSGSGGTSSVGGIIVEEFYQ